MYNSPLLTFLKLHRSLPTRQVFNNIPTFRMSKAKGSRKPPSAEQVTERILAECHEIYTDEENGLLGIAKSLGKLNFQNPLIIFRS